MALERVGRLKGHYVHQARHCSSGDSWKRPAKVPHGKGSEQKKERKKKDELFLKTFQQEAAHNPGALSEIDTLHDASERVAAAWPLPLPGIYGG